MFNHLETATELAIEFINAVLGPGYEYFGLKVSNSLMYIYYIFLYRMDFMLLAPVCGYHIIYLTSYYRGYPHRHSMNYMIHSRTS